jgi:amino acid transporter
VVRLNTHLQELAYSPNLFSYAIPIAAYSFLGIEIVAIAAFEARDASSIKWPSRSLPLVVLVLYVMCTIGEALNVSWHDTHLPYIYGGVGNSTIGQMPSNPTSVSMIINAAYDAGHRNMAGFLNGCLIFSVISASNTSLYVASRTLYGMIREMPDTNWLYSKIRWISRVQKLTGVPVIALLVSAISFCWLPFLQLEEGYALQDVSSLHSSVQTEYERTNKTAAH